MKLFYEVSSKIQDVHRKYSYQKAAMRKSCFNVQNIPYGSKADDSSIEGVSKKNVPFKKKNSFDYIEEELSDSNEKLQVFNKNLGYIEENTHLINSKLPQTSFDPNKNYRTNQLLYPVKPSVFATHMNHDIKIITTESPNAKCMDEPMSDLGEINLLTTNVEKKISSSDDICRVINRDIDTFYDDQLISNVIAKNNDLPKSLRIESREKDPILVYDEQNISKQKKINKREASRYDENDYNNNENEQDQKSRVVGSGFHGIKQKMSKLGKYIHPRDKNMKNVNETKIKFSSSKKENIQRLVPDSTLKPLMSTKSGGSTSIISEGSQTELKKDTEARNDEFQDNDIPVENENIISASRKKGCQNGQKKTEKANCLPTGGAPKNPDVPSIGRSKDSDYDRFIKGELAEKVVKTVLEKVLKNTKMSSELGICDADLKSVKDLYSTIRSKEKECCMKLQGELKCFLNWLLTVDQMRKKRWARDTSEQNQEEVSTMMQNIFPGAIPPISSGHELTPQYKKLAEKVEQLRDNGDEPLKFFSDTLGIMDKEM